MQLHLVTEYPGGTVKITTAKRFNDIYPNFITICFLAKTWPSFLNQIKVLFLIKLVCFFWRLKSEHVLVFILCLCSMYIIEFC